MTLPNGAMISAPPPMSVTFAEDHPGSGFRLVDEWWPGRLLIDGYLISLAKRGGVRSITLERKGEWFVSPLIVHFSLENAQAVYRETTRSETPQRDDDVYEFDCVSCSRDLEP